MLKIRPLIFLRRESISNDARRCTEIAGGRPVRSRRHSQSSVWARQFQHTAAPSQFRNRFEQFSPPHRHPIQLLIILMMNPIRTDTFCISLFLFEAYFWPNIWLFKEVYLNLNKDEWLMVSINSETRRSAFFWSATSRCFLRLAAAADSAVSHQITQSADFQIN